MDFPELLAENLFVLLRLELYRLPQVCDGLLGLVFLGIEKSEAEMMVRLRFAERNYVFVRLKRGVLQLQFFAHDRQLGPCRGLSRIRLYGFFKLPRGLLKLVFLRLIA